MIGAVLRVAFAAAAAVAAASITHHVYAGSSMASAWATLLSALS